MNGESKMTATTKQTLLQDIGNVLGKVFNVSLAVAAVAEPVVAVGFPGMATIYNLTLTAAAQAEQAAVAAGATQSTTLLKTIAATQAVTRIRAASRVACAIRCDSHRVRASGDPVSRAFRRNHDTGGKVNRINSGPSMTAPFKSHMRGRVWI
jgi:hypothetical protein